MANNSIGVYVYAGQNPRTFQHLIDQTIQPQSDLDDKSAYRRIRILESHMLRETYKQHGEIWLVGSPDSNNVEFLKSQGVLVEIYPRVSSFYEAFLLKVVFPGSRANPPCQGSGKQDSSDR